MKRPFTYTDHAPVNRVPTVALHQALYTAWFCGSAPKAARRLHISHMTLYRRLYALEREVGAELFERHKRPFTLTPAGHKIINGYIALKPRPEAICAPSWDAHLRREALCPNPS
jgi:hypothetical protein